MTTTSAPEATVTETLTEGRTFTHTVHPNYGNASYEMQEMTYEGEVLAVRAWGRLWDLCKRCGQGYGRFLHNGHDNVCYTCHDRGFSHEETTDAEVIRRYENRKKAAAARARKAAREAEKAREEFAAWVAANADLAEALTPHRTPVDEEGYADFDFRPADRFVTKMADVAQFSPLTEKQADAARKALARLAEKVAERQARNADRVAAGHWGEIKKRAEVTVTVTGCRFFDNDFGGSFLVSMKTAEGHVLKTWTSGAFVSDAQRAEESGEAITVKATVKEHGSYNDLPETTVSRVALA